MPALLPSAVAAAVAGFLCTVTWEQGTFPQIERSSWRVTLSGAAKPGKRCHFVSLPRRFRVHATSHELLQMGLVTPPTTYLYNSLHENSIV